MIKLTQREKELAKLLSQGLLVKEAAYQLGITNNTAESHRRNLYVKLEVHSRVELINAMRNYEDK